MFYVDSFEENQAFKEQMDLVLSPLHQEIENQNFEQFKQLIEKGANLEEGQWIGRRGEKVYLSEKKSPLHFAIEKKQTAFALYLIERNAKIKSLCRGKKVFHHAIEKGEHEVVEKLIQKGVNVNDIYKGLSPLYLALLYNYKDIAKMLISAGCQLESKFYAKDEQDNCYYIAGKTPLHFLIEQNETDFAILLIQAGARLDPLYQNKTPLEAAIEKENLCIVLALLNSDSNAFVKGSRLSPLYRAIMKNNVPIVKALIEASANLETELYVKSPDQDYFRVFNKTPIFYAIENNLIDIANLLIQAGANIEMLYQERTPLHHAIKYQKDAIAIALIEAGANCEKKYEDKTALWHALSNKSYSICVSLIKNGANITAKHLGQTAYSHFVIHWPLLVDALLYYGTFNFTTRFHRGNTLLHMMIQDLDKHPSHAGLRESFKIILTYAKYYPQRINLNCINDNHLTVRQAIFNSLTAREIIDEIKVETRNNAYRLKGITQTPYSSNKNDELIQLLGALPVELQFEIAQFGQPDYQNTFIKQQTLPLFKMMMKNAVPLTPQDDLSPSPFVGPEDLIDRPTLK